MIAFGSKMTHGWFLLLTCLFIQTIPTTSQDPYGPTTANLDFGDNDEIHLCPSTFSDTVLCATNTAVPSATYTLSYKPKSAVSFEKTIEPVNTSDATGEMVATFIVAPLGSGTYVVKCIGVNDAAPFIKGVHQREVQVQKAPLDRPTIKINKGEAPHNGTLYLPSFRQVVTCFVGPATPAVSSLDLTCGNKFKSGGNKGVSVNFMMTQELNDTLCECSYAHVTNCTTSTTTTTTLMFVSMPDWVRVSLPRTFSLCPNDNSTMNISCFYNHTQIIPDVSIDFTGPAGYPEQPTSFKDVEDIRYAFYEYRPTAYGTYSTGCEIVNTLRAASKIENYGQIIVLEPPDYPNLTISGPGLHDDGSVTKQLLVGKTVTVNCKVNGGYPPVARVNIDCGGNVDSIAGNEASLVFTVNFTSNGGKCLCSYQQDHSCSFSPPTYLLDVVSGPDAINLDDGGKPTFSICRSENTNWTLACHVDMTNVNPDVTVTFRGIREIPSSPTDVIKNGSDAYFVYEFRPTVPGIFKTSCYAKNTAYPAFGKFLRKILTIFEQPNAPNLTISGEGLHLDDEVKTVLDGKQVTVNCKVEGGYPPVSSITLDCVGNSNTTTGEIESSLELDVNSTFDQQNCTCSYQQASSCEVVTPSFNFTALYGPSVVDISPVLASFSLCSSKPKPLMFTCSVDESTINPGVNVTFSGLPGYPFTTDKTDLSGSIRNYRFYQRPTPGNFDLQCQAMNTAHSQFIITSPIQRISILERPNAPILTISGEGLHLDDEVKTVLGGKQVTVNCKVEGGYPAVSSVTLDCVGISNTTAGIESSLELDVNSTFDQQNCTCSYQQASSCEVVTPSFKFTAWYGPSIVNFGPNNLVPFSLCPSETLALQIYCLVENYDVNPGINVTFNGIPGFPSSTTRTSDVRNGRYYYYSFRPTLSGIHDSTCEAINTAYPKFNVSSPLTKVTVYEPPNAPTLTISGEGLHLDDEVKTVLDGKQVTVNCRVEGGYPTVSSVTLNCVGISNTTDGIESSLELNVTSNFDQQKCVCSYQHPAFCETVTPSFKFTAWYGPSIVSISKPSAPFSLCPSETSVLRIFCFVSTSDTNPGVNVIFHGIPGSSSSTNETSDLQNGRYYFYKFRPTLSGIHDSTCEAINTAYPKFNVSSPLTKVTVYEPPSAPTLTISGEGLHLDDEVKTVLDGKQVTVNCKVEGGYPTVSSVTLDCVGNSNTTDGIESTLELDVNSTFDQQNCTCSYQHPSACDKVTASFDFIAWYGPNNVDIGPQDQSPFSLCPSDDSTLTMFCKVDNSTINPGAVVTLSGIPGLPSSPTNLTSTGNEYSYIYEFRPTRSGKHKSKCEAVNTAYSQFITSSTLKIVVYEPPNAPTLTISGEGLHLDNEVKTVLGGKQVTVNCRVEGGYPTVSSVTLDCVGNSNTTDRIESTLELDVNSTFDQQNCTCSYQHPSACNKVTASFDFIAWYGPNNVNIGPKSTTSFSLCPSDSSTLDLHCTVQNSTINPGVTVTFTGIPGGPPSTSQVTKNGDDDIYHFRFRPTENGQYTSKCTAVNTDFSSFSTDDSLVIDIYEPPPDKPEVKLGVLVVKDGETKPVRLGQTYVVSCKVPGGYPDVSSITIECPNQSQTVSGTEATLELNITKSEHMGNCSCSYVHISTCNPLSSSFILNVQFPPKIIDCTINSKSDNLALVDKEQNVEFNCLAEGNPLPEMSIKVGENSQQDMSGGIQNRTRNGQFGQLLSYNKVMGCKESNTYTFVISNTIGDAVKIRHSVRVRSGPELLNVETLLDGPILSTTLEICIYPDPTEFHLRRTTKVDNNSRRKKRDGETSDVEVDSSQYTVQFVRDNPQYGTVTLELVDTNDFDISEYDLQMINGIEGETNLLSEVTFNISRAEVLATWSKSDTNGNGYKYVFSLVIASILAICMLCLLIFGIHVVRRIQQKYVKSKKKTSALQNIRRRDMSSYQNDFMFGRNGQRVSGNGRRY